MFEVAFGFCNLLLLIHLMPGVKRSKMSVAFPLPPVWRQERHTSGGWKGLRDDLTYANSCPGRQPVRQLLFALVLDLLN
jgi:hypothetical protein